MKRIKNDFLYKLKIRIRSLIRQSLVKKGFSKSSRSSQILGCSFDEFKSYLLDKAKLRYPDFEPKNFLENNKYHIDHIIPLAQAKNEEEVIKLCHYTNLQLLTKEDNLEKLDSLDWK